MPIHSGKDRQGYFYQWGETGKKYYYDPVSRQSATTAYNKAKKQQTAIYSSGWKGDEKMKMKLLKVVKKDSVKDSKKNDVKAKVLPTDSRTNAQIKARVAGYISKVEALNLDINRYLQRQINASNSELAALTNDVNKIGHILDELASRLSSL